VRSCQGNLSNRTVELTKWARVNEIKDLRKRRRSKAVSVQKSMETVWFNAEFKEEINEF